MSYRRPVGYLGASTTEQIASEAVLVRDRAVGVAKAGMLLGIGAAGGLFVGFWLGFYAGRNP